MNGDVEDTPIDDIFYGRINGNWVRIDTLRRRGSWATITATNIMPRLRYKRYDIAERHGRQWEALADNVDQEPGTDAAINQWRCLTPFARNATAIAAKSIQYAKGIFVPSLADPAVLAPLDEALAELAAASSRGSGNGMFRDRGVWASSTATGPTGDRYKRLDVVDYEGRFWICVEDDEDTAPAMLSGRWRCMTLATSEAAYTGDGNQMEALDNIYGRDPDDLVIKSLSALIGDLRAQIETLEGACGRKRTLGVRFPCIVRSRRR